MALCYGLGSVVYGSCGGGGGAGNGLLCGTWDC